jgi:uncharacterized membrane protein YozB (DUF420 family)
MLELHQLPALNAGLNATSGVLLTAGYGLIRSGRRSAHAACMLAACITSTLFLASYLIYHAQAGSTHFTGEGWIRPVYFTILGTHTLLAMTVPFLAAVTLVRALSLRFDKHRRIARVTLPIWLYVSVTGVVIYWLLYHAYPAR